MKLRKKLKGLMVLALLVSVVLLGCKPKEAAVASSSDEDDMSEHFKYTMGALNWGQLTASNYNVDGVAKHFEDKFNFELDLSMSTWADWESNPRIWISSGDMPDFLHTNFNAGDYSSWREQGLIRELPDDWKTKYPNIAKIRDANGLDPALDRIMGGKPAVYNNNTYYFNKPTSPIIAGHYAIWLRKDWLTALGFEVKDTYSLVEIETMVESFKANRSKLPGVNARTDSLLVDAGNLQTLYFTYQWAETTRFYKDSTGKYVWGPDDPRVLGLLQHLKEGIARGIPSANYASFKNQEEMSLFFTGQGFATLGHGWLMYVFNFYNQFQEATGLNPFDCLHEAVLVDTEGHYQEYAASEAWSCLYFSPKMSQKKMNRLLSIIDYMGSPEGYEIMHLGFEGKDFTRDGDKITITRPKDATGNFVELHTVYPFTGVFSHVPICPDDFYLTSPVYPQEYQAPPNRMFATKQKLGIDTGTIRPVPYELNFFEGPSYRKYSTSVIGDELLRVALMNGDLRTNYNNWIKDMRPVIDPILKELNDALGAK